MADVRRLAEAVQKATPRLQLLINNAGLGSGAARTARQTSADGHELIFAVNYLAGFLLTHRLLPLIKAARRPVSSMSRRSASRRSTSTT